MDLHKIITNAKLGSERKDAQITTCTVFSAALYDVLRDEGFRPEIHDANLYQVIESTKKNQPSKKIDIFCHVVVKFRGKFYDSLGLFTEERARRQIKIYKNLRTELALIKSCREYDERDYGELHAFFVKKLKKSLEDDKKQKLYSSLKPF